MTGKLVHFKMKDSSETSVLGIIFIFLDWLDAVPTTSQVVKLHVIVLLHNWLRNGPRLTYIQPQRDSSSDSRKLFSCVFVDPNPFLYTKLLKLCFTFLKAQLNSFSFDRGLISVTPIPRALG